MRIQLLGGFGVSVGLRTVGEGEWSLRKAASLVKLLALAPEHRLHRERVTELLWPKRDPKAATNNFHYAIHYVRRALEPAARGARASRYLVLRDESLALCPEVPLWVDAEAFEEAADIARRTRDLAAYRAAIDVYTGELLPQDRYEAWAEDRREGLRWLYLRLLVELAGLYEEREDFESAIEALVEAVAKEPAYEEAHAGLMRLYARSNRRREAILQYERFCNALSEEPGFEPGEASRRLYEEIRTGQFLTARLPQEKEERPPKEPIDDSRHNLPATRTSFIGRKRELAELKRELARSWLVTLTGAGGCGKTRLALEVVRDLAGAYPDGVWQAELVGLTEPALVPQAVAAALKVREQPNRPLMDTLVDTLRNKRMLLVLDNCEHLLDGASRLVETLLKSCPNLRILATSREPLGIAGEVRWRVPSLSFPDPKRAPAVEETEELLSYESVRLFVDRARQRDPAFALTKQNLRAVVEICEKLEGIPLTLELAAARVGVLSAEQIAERLEDSIKLLTVRDRTAHPRHQTLRGTLDWSYELLGEPEKRLFERLSVFAGGWTLEAAEAVGAGDGIEGEEILDLLSSLVDKSLVVAEMGDEGGLRYRMLEPIRQYGREKFEESGEAEPVKRRHAAFFLVLAEEAGPELRGSRQAEWLEQLEVEHDNLRAALSWALERGEVELGLRLCGVLGTFWRIRGYLSEGRRWLEAALANKGTSSASARARALIAAGHIAWEQADFERSTVLSEEGLGLSRESGDTASTAAALYNLGMTALMYRMEYERASVLLEEAAALQREMGDVVGLLFTLQGLGLTAASSKDHERAMALHQESLALAQEMENRFGIALSLGLGALTCLYQGDYQRATAICTEGLEASRQLGWGHAMAFMLHISAALAGAQGQPVRSARLWGAAEVLYEAIGITLARVQRHHYGPYIEAARAQVEEAAWEEAWAEGRAMALEEAVEYALTTEEEQSSSVRATAPEEPPAPLTRREREVAVLVGRGLTNRRIAEELSISEHTAITHVRNILKKLEIHSRAEITARLAEQGHL